MGCIYALNENDEKNISVKGKKDFSTEKNEGFSNYFVNLHEEKCKSDKENGKLKFNDNPIYIKFDNNKIDENAKNDELTNTNSLVKISTSPNLNSSNYKLKPPKTLTLFFDNHLLSEESPIKVIIKKNVLTKSSGEQIEKHIEPIITYTFGKIDHSVDFSFIDSSVSDHQFNITYDSALNQYYAHDIEYGTGIFYKLKKKKIIPHDNYIVITFCNLYLRLEVYEEDNSSLKITFLDKKFKNKEVVINPRTKKIVKLGRGNQVDILINEQDISRIQWTAKYDGINWWLFDGNVEKNGEQKCSMNGIWIQIIDKMELYNDLVLKTGMTVIEVKLKGE